MMFRFMLPGCALVLAGLTATTASAGNGTHPRTPVKWDPEPPCMTIVDRSVDPKLTFNYTIPYEDLKPVDATDEVDDSRRHQFIAFCRGQSVQVSLPVWLSPADVAVAKAAKIIGEDDVQPDDIFDGNPEWADCFARITGDDERRKITFAEAKKPVVWDTTGLPTGVYTVSGYTWEPAFNTWSTRPGVVKVVDDPDPSKNGPALAILNRDEIKYADEVLTLTGCVDAMDGSTITGYWSRTDSEDTLDWQSFGVDTPVSGDSFELPLEFPPGAIGTSITLKVEITDPMDRTYTAHMLTLADILEGSGGDSGDCDDMNFILMPGCEASSSGGGSEGSGATSETTGAMNVTTTGDEPGPTTSTTSGTAVTGTGGASEGSDATGDTPQLGDGGCGGCAVEGGALGGGGLPAMLVAPWLLWATRRRRR